jgi:hypothetical protein
LAVTEAQLQAFPEFRRLPIYDESDQRADTITNRTGPYKVIREYTTVQQIQDALKNPGLVPLGAIRVAGIGGRVVIAYFAEKP